MKTESIVTPADHDAAFKEIEVVYRSGKRETIKLIAPPYRRSQSLALEIQKSKDTICISDACLNGTRELPHFLNSLTIESAALVETVSFALTFGDDFQKKMEAYGTKALEAMGLTDSAPSSTSSAAVILQTKSGTFPCPSCGCITPFRVNLRSPRTSATPSSAQPVG